MSDNIWSEIDTTMQTGGVSAALDQLAVTFITEKRWHELFDLRLMQARAALGLPAVGGGSLDELPVEQRERLEQGYLSACSEIGGRLLAAGNLREAWMYLRPTGNTAEMAKAIEQAEIDDDSIEELIELALQEKINPVFGYQLLLRYHGTCNAITVYDSEFPACSRADQQAAARLLVQHLHAELLGNVRGDIQRRQGTTSPETTIAALINERDWLFGEHNYHIDTTHLNSVVRIGRICDDRLTLSLLVDLCAYGQRLSKQFQFEGDPPFENMYQAGELFFGAQLGRNIEQAVAYFAEKAAAADPLVIGTGPAEVYVVLLQRLQRWSAAISECARLLPPGTRTGGFAPGLLDLSRQAGDFTLLKQLCRERNDLLNYAAALALEADTQRASAG